MPTAEFNYFEASPQHWPERVRAYKNQGVSTLSVPCLWGVHEQMRGNRDFSRSPKSRLEKIFTEAKQNHLSLELCFGFPAHEYAFPKWSLAQKNTGLNPAVLWSGQDRGYEFRFIPSFADEEFQSGYLEFLEEAISLASLYIGDGGPITKVKVDFGVLGSDLALATTPPYLELFQGKYKTADTLNLRFTTNFRALSVSHPDQLFRSLFERRPWITAYDYRLFRKELLQRFKSKIEKLSIVQQVGSNLSIEADGGHLEQPKDRCFVIDSTFLDFSKLTVAPFFPQRMVNPMSAFAYRVVEFCDRFAKREDFGLVGISENQVKQSSQLNYLVAVSGKYMSSQAVSFLEMSASSGADVFFPFGFPLYKEDGSETPWHQLGNREVLKNRKKPLIRIPSGKGSLFSAIGALPLDNQLGNSLKEYEEVIRGN